MPKYLGFFYVVEDLDVVIGNVIREYKWDPFSIERLYLDRQDYLGLLYWHDDIVEMDKKYKSTLK